VSLFRSSTMPRPIISGVKGDQFELKTLKLSKETRESIRKPRIWVRPNSGLYDYHYAIGGLYYQPMINYCIEREHGGERRNVDMPDRIKANFDKRAFVLSGEALDYEDFLTGMYKRRIRVDNTKTIDCGVKLYTNSKENSRLNDYRDSAQQRDKYLCQIQMHHTGNVAKKENLALAHGEHFSEEEHALRQQENQEEKEMKMRALGINKDDRYGPAFQKVSSLNSYDKSWDPLQEFFTKPKEEAVENKECKEESSSQIIQESSSKVTRIVMDAAGNIVEEEITKKESGFKPIVKKELLDADNMNDWLRLRVKGGAKRVEKEVKPQYIDTGYAKALDYVQERVRKAGVEPGQEKMTTKNFNYFFGGRKTEDIGKHSKAAIYTNMRTIGKIPDFDVGYDTINSIKEARVIR